VSRVSESIPLRRAAYACLALVLAAAALSAIRAGSGTDTVETMSALVRDGNFAPKDRVARGTVVGEFDGRPITLEGTAPVEIAASAIQLVGHDDARTRLLFRRVGEVPEIGPAGEQILYVRAQAGIYLRVFCPEPAVP